MHYSSYCGFKFFTWFVWRVMYVPKWNILLITWGHGQSGFAWYICPRACSRRAWAYISGKSLLPMLWLLHIYTLLFKSLILPHIDILCTSWIFVQLPPHVLSLLLYIFLFLETSDSLGTLRTSRRLGTL